MVLVRVRGYGSGVRLGLGLRDRVLVRVGG